MLASDGRCVRPLESAMVTFRKLALAFAVALILSPLAPATLAAKSMSEAERSALQAAMVQHIDRQSIDGLYLHIDLSDGRVVEFAPAKSHPMMFRLGEHFVLCTEFKDARGADVNVDFYVARAGKTFSVFRAEIDNRAPLMKLMAQGKVSPVD
jgi:hypothetical protein